MWLLKLLSPSVSSWSWNQSSGQTILISLSLVGVSKSSNFLLFNQPYNLLSTGPPVPLLQTKTNIYINWRYFYILCWIFTQIPCLVFYVLVLFLSQRQQSFQLWQWCSSLIILNSNKIWPRLVKTNPKFAQNFLAWHSGTLYSNPDLVIIINWKLWSSLEPFIKSLHIKKFYIKVHGVYQAQNSNIWFELDTSVVSQSHSKYTAS